MFTTALLIASLQTAAAGQIGIEAADANGAVRVTSVDAAGPAARFAKPGDTIVSIDRIPTPTLEIYDAIVSRIRAGDAIVVVLNSEGVTLGHRIKAIAPAAPGEVAIVDHTQEAAPAPMPAAPTTAAPPARASTQLAPKPVAKNTPFVFSAFGNEIGKTAVGVGLAYHSELLGEVNVVTRFTKLVSLDVNLGTNLSTSYANLGARFTVVEGESFAVAARVRVHATVANPNDTVVLGGMSGGLLASFGNDAFNATLGVDATHYEFAWVDRSSGVFENIGYGVRPYAAVEFHAVQGVAIYGMGFFERGKVGTARFSAPGVAIGATY
ncbi:MAG: hypothetical protein RMA76_36660 [Deltaproteobacteria bacterium]|jgi:hypothetical protein